MGKLRKALNPRVSGVAYADPNAAVVPIGTTTTNATGMTFTKTAYSKEDLAKLAAAEEKARGPEIIDAINTSTARDVQMPSNVNFLRYGRDYKQPSFFTNIAQPTELRADSQAKRPGFLQSLFESTKYPEDLYYAQGGRVDMAGTGISSVVDQAQTNPQNMQHSFHDKTAFLQSLFPNGYEQPYAKGGMAKKIFKVRGKMNGYAKGGLSSKIRELRARIKNEEGEYAAKRLDRATDEVRNLETTFNLQALRDAFMGENTKGLAVINPADYEKYAASIPKQGYDETHAGPVYRIGDKAVTYDEYIKYLQHIANTTGLKSVPLLGVDKNKENLLTIPMHEGRHRQRALAGLGDTKALVQVLTGPSIREPLPRKTKEEGIEAVKSVISKKPAITEDALRNYKPDQVLTADDLVILPEIFKRGGRV